MKFKSLNLLFICNNYQYTDHDKPSLIFGLVGMQTLAIKFWV